MKRAARLVILLLFFVKVLYAQQGSGDSKFCIEIPPLAYFDAGVGPSYPIGVEIKLYQNFSACFSGGGYFGLNGHDWLTNEFTGGRLTDVKGYDARLEIKYYLNREETGEYFSIEGRYKKQEFNWQDSIHLTPAYLTTFRDFKNIYCLTAKFGCQFLHKSRIVIDCYVGLGVRFKNVSTTLTSQQVDALKYSDDSNYDSDETGTTVIPGNYATINFEAGFKIGYQIK